MERQAITELDLGTLLPGHARTWDHCTEELTRRLQAHEGISSVLFEPHGNSMRFVFEHDPALLPVRKLTAAALAEGERVQQRYQHESLSLSGLHCGHCATKVEAVIGTLPGVFTASVNFGTEKLTLGRDAELISSASITATLKELGYRVTSGAAGSNHADQRLLSRLLPPDLALSLLAGLSLVTGWSVSTFAGLPEMLSMMFYLGAYAAGGYHAAVHALRAARKRRFDIDILMIAAALGAAVLGQWAEGALLLFLFSLGHALQNLASNKARGAIRSLTGLTPKTARVLGRNGERDVPVEQLEPGEIVVIHEGERIPADGVVLTGESSVDQASITGESLPVLKIAGDTVHAGTINGSGALQVRATKRHADTTLAQVIRLVEEAQSAKSPTQRFSEQLERMLVPSLLLLALALVLVPPLFGMPLREAFLKSMTLLVAASPCALALATPSAVLSAIARAARSGVLVKGGAHLELAGTARVVVFDKTGTLTTGKPIITDIDAVDGNDEGLLQLAAAAEYRSAHPLAGAVKAAAEGRSLKVSTPEWFTATPGRGVHARVTGREVLVGNAAFLQENGLRTGTAVREQVGKLEEEGKTLLLVAVDGVYRGLMALRDEPRPEAKAVIADLRRAGITRTVMLTGDNVRVATALAASLGIDEVQAGLLPAEKASAIGELEQHHGPVIMVGDGVNDAPALATASVGIAIGGATNAVALETADIALLSGNLESLPFALRLSRASRRLIMQNLIMSLGVIALLVPGALLGIAGIGIAVVLHESSTLVVVANALRLLGFRRSGIRSAE
jgi:Cd2+/Zn2+-exporting ATPase